MDNLNMKRTLLSLGTVVLLTLAGCSSGGDSGGSTAPVGSGTGGGGTGGGGTGGGGTGGGGAQPSMGITSVSGTTGGGSSSSVGSSSSLFAMDASSTANSDNGTATLVVDSNGDKLLDSKDTRYSVAIESDGSFSFDNVAVDATKKVLAQLRVEKDGFAPVIKTLKLKKDAPVSVLAKIDTKPVLTQVVKLPATAAGRANAFLKFGITQSSEGIKSFSKLMTLSELQAETENGVDLGAGTLSTSYIPASAFDSNVSSVTVKMQAFDSTKKEDIALFPGEFSGHGKLSVGASAIAAGDVEQPLESAAFDMIKLSDQNGNDIQLQSVASSKLSSQLDASSCNGMYWTRRVTSDQAIVINRWGDDDNDTSGYQVPIWSNDNATGTWEYVGEGDWDGSSSFSACVDKKWEGYLNCDSSISISKPKTICVAAKDHNGNPLGGGEVQARNGNNYNYVYLDNNGQGELGLTSGSANGSSYSYSGAITGWSSTIISTSSITSSSTNGCDYDMNLTIDDPYSAQVYVFATDENNKSLSNSYVYLTSSNYRDYYNKGAYTNTKGYAIFKVKPNVDYTASFLGGRSSVNVNGSINPPETADSGKYASVEVQGKNVAPRAYIYTDRRSVTTATESLKFTISASDANNDPLTLRSIKLNDTSLTSGTDYTVENHSSYNGHYYLSAKLDLNSTTVSTIVSGNNRLTASVSDGKLSSTSSTDFSVTTNHKPIINSIYLRDDSYNYYYKNSSIHSGTSYSIGAYAYDIDGDSVTTTISLDGTNLGNAPTNPADSPALSSGDHNITAIASDGTLSTTKTIQIHAGNNAPEITNAGATKYRVDINTGETFKLYAYAQDKDGDFLSVSAIDANGTVYPMTLPYGYGTKYISNSIKLTSVLAKNDFTIIANDGEDNSTVATVSVESYAQNQAPIFTKALTSKSVNVNAQTTFECVATDSEGTFVTYSWSLDDQALSETTQSYTTTFSTIGAKHLSCTATDGDGESATSSATILVVNPTQSGTLSVHTGLANMKAILHDSTTLAPMTEKTTDANGDVSFSVAGDRATFSLTRWSGMAIDQTLLLKLIKEDFLAKAYQACENNSSVATECSSADWCAMPNAGTIENWVWDIGKSNANSGQNIPQASDIDSNGDRKISASELYAKALPILDKDSNGVITYDEYNGDEESISTEMFVNVPVREYYIRPSSEEYVDHGYYNHECEDTTSFDANLTLHTDASNVTFTGSTSGSGYGYIYEAKANQNGDVKMPLTVYNQANDGTYSLLVRERTTNDQKDYFYFLKDQSKANLQKGITLNTSKFQLADKNVTIKTHYYDTNHYSTLSITAQYKGLELENSSASTSVDSNTSIQELYANSNFTYMLWGQESTSQAYSYHRNYYSDDTLKDSYDSDNYPMLDANVAFNKDGGWTLSGSELSKVNAVTYSLYANGTDENGSYSLDAEIHWTVAPTQSPDLNITAIVPSDLNQTAQEILSKTSFQGASVNVQELKGLSEAQFIDLVASSVAVGNIDSYKVRENDTSYNPSSATTAGTLSASSTRNSMKQHRVKQPFTIGFDVSKLFSK